MDVIFQSIIPNVVLKVQPCMTSALTSFGGGGALKVYLADAV